MNYIRVRKFSELQHYKDRRDNPWIKFYVRLLDDEEMNALPVETRYLWDRLLLLAQRNGNVIRSDPERIAKLFCMETEHVREGIDQLLKGRWLSQTSSPRRASKHASKMLALARARKRREDIKALGVDKGDKGAKPAHVWQDTDDPVGIAHLLPPELFNGNP